MTSIATTAKTRENILRLLAHLGIKHALKFSDDLLDNLDRSRVKAMDVDGLILRHLEAKLGDFTEGSGANHSAHGYKVNGTWRSISTPSIQFCRIPAKGGDYDYVFEVDIDRHSPDVNPVGHIGELIENVGPRTTNPNVIAKMIDKLENKQDA
jgi:hypothetical protein